MITMRDSKRQALVIVAALVAIVIAVALKVFWRPAAGDVASKSLATNSAQGITEPTGARQSTWPDISYQEARAYYYREWPQQPGGGILDYVDPKKGVLLNAAQERRLISALRSRVPPRSGVDLWYPQNALVLFDPFGKPVREVVVSFNSFFVVAHGISDSPDLVAIADLVDELGLPVGEYKDAETFLEEYEKLPPM